MKTPIDDFVERHVLRRPSETCVFVYGTLLRGERNHHHLKHARLLGQFKTRGEFRLVDLGSFPAMLRGGTTIVAGEAYLVDAETLTALDRFEGVPHLYRRVRIELQPRALADAYLLAPERGRGAPEIASGDWRAHRQGQGRP